MVVKWINIYDFLIFFERKYNFIDRYLVGVIRLKICMWLEMILCIFVI